MLYAINNNAISMNLAPVKYFAQEIIRLETNYSNDSSNISTLSQIAKSYLKMGNQDGAAKYICMVLKKDRKNKEALTLLSEIKK